VRIAVISDTHLPRGARRLPDRCVEEVRAADLVLHAGDIATVGVLEELEGLAGGPDRVCAVLGNVDEPALADRGVPVTRTVEAGGARIAIVHDAGRRAGREERLVARFRGCDAVVHGHTHVPQAERHGGVWILNPGSPTERRTSPGWSMLQLRIRGGAIEPELIALT
jgi:putative phosphoesterase